MDLLEISGGSYESPGFMGLGGHGQSTDGPEAYSVDFAVRVRRQVATPLMLTDGLRTEATMRIVASGTVDMVALARPLASEPRPRTR